MLNDTNRRIFQTKDSKVIVKTVIARSAVIKVELITSVKRSKKLRRSPPLAEVRQFKVIYTVKKQIVQIPMAQSDLLCFSLPTVSA